MISALVYEKVEHFIQVTTFTMKGILLDKVGGEYHLEDTIEKPTPGRKQVLVKSLVTAINPVYYRLSPHPTTWLRCFTAKNLCKAAVQW